MKAAKKRFNLLDAAIILLVLLCVAGIFQRENLRKVFSAGETMDAYIVTFEIRKLRSTTADLLDKDTQLYLFDEDVRCEFGKLNEHVSATAATTYLANDKGEMVEAVYPEDEYEYLLDVTGVLTCFGTSYDGSFLLGGKTYLAANQELVAYTEEADLKIRIIGIEKVG